VGIAGTGFVGRIHARAALRAGGTLAGVAASTPDRGAEAAAELGAEQAFDSAEELVVADGIDVVHICVPNHLHASLSEAAMAAGKRVICEKPLAVDSAGAAGLVAASARAGAPGFVPFVYRYYPTLREARDRVRGGATGKVRLLHGTYLQDWLLTPEDSNWRVDAGLGGPSRAFADIGSHWCDLAEFVTGHRITRLSARTMTAIPERASDGGAAFERGGDRSASIDVETEDAVVTQFETDAGALGSLVVSQVSPGRKNRLWLEVDGARETVVFDQENPETLWCGRRDVSMIVPRDPDSLSSAAARLTTLPGGHPQGYGDCFDGFVADAYEAISTGNAPEGLPTFEDGLRAVQLTEAVLTSAREQAWVDVGAGAEVTA
jgi:predicted dehydrogenase